MLVFRREAFLTGTTDPDTFHQRAIEEGRFYEERGVALEDDRAIFPSEANACWTVNKDMDRNWGLKTFGATEMRN